VALAIRPQRFVALAIRPQRFVALAIRPQRFVALAIRPQRFVALAIGPQRFVALAIVLNVANHFRRSFPRLATASETATSAKANRGQPRPTVAAVVQSAAKRGQTATRCGQTAGKRVPDCGELRARLRPIVV
jgi:hypothetical protein